MDYMTLAFRLAKKADPYPNPRVGAVIVNNGKIIGQGYHRKAGMPHAEIEAMADAKMKGHSLKGATLYVSLEPCSHTNKRTPPCTEAIAKAKIGKVVYGMDDPNPFVSGAKMLRNAGIAVKGPVAQKKAEAINKRYIERITRKPFVAIKMAMTADGRTATRTGDSKWISCKESRDFVHRLRAGYDAVMIGAGTVRKDNPRLTARGKGRDPLRIIVDGRLDLPQSCHLLRNRDGKTIIATTEKPSRKKIERIAKESAAHVFVCGKKQVDLSSLIKVLGAMGVNKILIEGGSEMNASAIDARIVDKIYLFIAPKIIGGKDAKGVIGGKGMAKISEAKKLKGMKISRIGKDFLLEGDF